tara:strand:- start:738 stop:1511 length:774 start_codon:yes stop_codon:yes gene_type:complete
MKRFNSEKDLKEFLEEKYLKYNNKNFIEFDPIKIPHSFTKKEDIEISAFLTSIISWGNRKMIIKNAKDLMNKMDLSPYDFIINSNQKDIQSIDFCHRTFNSMDLHFFIKSLKNIYKNHGGLEKIFSVNYENKWLFKNIKSLKEIFFSIDHPIRTKKHISDPSKGSACKRINMFLRWMVRKDTHGIDFGIWNKISPSKLSCPLDIHTHRIGRKLGLIKSKQSDIKTLKELDIKLRKFDEKDPVKYDYALFSIGINDDI